MHPPHRLTYAASAILLFICLTPANADTSSACRADSNDEVSVHIKAVGDIVLGSDWPRSQYPPDFDADALRRLRRALGTADVIFGNFEGALTTHNVSTKNANGRSVFAFRMPPRFATLLSQAGFTVMAIANNHTFDFGAVGFRDTVRHLADSNMLVVGEPDRIALQRVGDIRIAWIGFSHLSRHNHVADLDKLSQMVRDARQQADLVIVSLQAGAEGAGATRVVNRDEMFLGENRGNTFAFARRAVDLGADLVLGHGPHVLRGMECYKGKLIAYSLGNFVGYGALSTRGVSAISMVLDVRLARDGRTLGFDVTALRFDDEKFPEPDPANFSKYFINQLSRLPPLNGSVHLQVPEDGYDNYRRWLEGTGWRGDASR